MTKKKSNKKKVNETKKTKKTEVAEVKEVKETKEIVKEEKVKKEKKATNTKENTEPKRSLWVRFRIFCHGVASEAKRIHWVSKENLIKYSIATIVFVIFLALFFYCIDVIFAAIQTLFK